MSTAIVTGGAKGIGRAIVEELAKSGINVVINYNKSRQLAQDLKRELRSKGYNVETYRADVSKKESAIHLVNYTINTFSDIDILINNAGIDQWKMVCDITPDEWNGVLKNNINSAFFMSQEVLKYMIPKKSGCIINISSVWGITGASCEVAYSVSKAAIDGLTKSLAKEVGPSGIRVNSIAPGIINTDMNNNLTPSELQEIKEQVPLGKIGKPEDIARCVKWLVEDEYTTGQIISPNGGWVI